MVSEVLLVLLIPRAEIRVSWIPLQECVSKRTVYETAIKRLYEENELSLLFGLLGKAATPSG